MQVTRIGTYGVVLKNECLLLVTQVKGPYENKFDFPGGGLEFGESVEEALKREFKEEVASDFETATFLANLTTTVNVPRIDNKEEYVFYQIGLIYLINGLKPLPNVIADMDYQWVPLNELTKSNSSALLWKFISLKLYL